jgi:hypothetical protein
MTTKLQKKNNQKRIKVFKITVKNLKKKIVLKKKFKIKYTTLKKKKLNIIYKNFCLGNRSLLYKLNRKLLTKKLLLQSMDSFLKLKFRLKKLSLVSNNNFFLRLVNFIPVFTPINTRHEKKKNKKKFKFCLSITIHSNNIFINLAKYSNRTFNTVKFWSAGLFDFVCSKTKLKFAISTMFKEIKIKLKKLKIYIIKIKAPKHLNKYIFKQLSRLLYKSKFLIYSSFKIYNGCRSSKKRRKKRLKFRFFR